VDAGGTAAHTIPTWVRISFYAGAVVFLGAVLWTIFTTKEYPPPDLDAFRKAKAEAQGFRANAREIFQSIGAMPTTMRQLALVQICTWLGLFCMWLYFPVAVAHNVFGASSETSRVYTDGVQWAGLCFGMYSAVCFLFSFLLPGLAAWLGRKNTHSLCLLCGAGGLISVAVIHDKWLLLFSMAGVGIAWASTLAMPYAILAGCLPANKVGVYMGVFNFSIVLPEIVASLAFGWLMGHVFDNNRLAAVITGGIFMILAAILMQRVQDRTAMAPASLKPVPAT
jgi:maltose/moltooligosaccharide transporter